MNQPEQNSSHWSPTEAGLAPETPSGKPPQPWLPRVFKNPSGLRAGWRLLAFLVIFIGAAAVLSGLTRGLMRTSAGHFTPRFLLTGEGMLLLATFISTAGMRFLEGRSWADYALPLRHTFGVNFWRGVLWGWIALTGLLLLIRYYHGFNFGSLALRSRRVILHEAIIWAVCFLVVGFFEEFLFRGYALYTLTTGIGFWPAAILLSAAFGAVHLRNPGEDWMGGLSAAAIGVFFCFTVRRTGSLWFAIGLHAMWDYSETFLYSVPDSGIMAPGHLLNSSFHGPAWLTGGGVGPEGSAFIFILIAGLFIVFHFLYPKARFPREHPVTAAG